MGSTKKHKLDERERRLGLETANLVANLAGRVVRQGERVAEQDRQLGELADPPAEARRRLAEAVTAEQSAWRRRSPARSRWPELVALDERVTDLDRRQAALVQEVAELEERLRAAEQADREALSQWLAAGEQGARPLPIAPAVKEKLEARRAERDAVEPARERLLAQKASFVAKHRGRLVREADQATQEAQARYLRRVEELERERVALYEARATALWAALYPSELMNTLPPTAIAGGLRKPVQEALGITTQLAPDMVWKLLRADAAALAEGATHEQRAALEGRDPRQDANAAVWSETEEGRQAALEEKKEALRRYRQLWGRDPA